MGCFLANNALTSGNSKRAEIEMPLHVGSTPPRRFIAYAQIESNPVRVDFWKRDAAFTNGAFFTASHTGAGDFQVMTSCFSHLPVWYAYLLEGRPTDVLLKAHRPTLVAASVFECRLPLEHLLAQSIFSAEQLDRVHYL